MWMLVALVMTVFIFKSVKQGLIVVKSSLKI